eukprot:7607196-Pyramimonas_sp.AAC.1
MVLKDVLWPSVAFGLTSAHYCRSSRASTHHRLRLDLRSCFSLGPQAVGMAAARSAPWIMYVALLVQGVSNATSMMVGEGIHRDIDPYNASRTSDSMKEVHEVQE